MLPTHVRRPGRLNFDTPFEGLNDEFNRVIRSYFGAPADTGNGAVTGAYPVDIHEDNERIYVDAEVPGFTREEITVTLEDGLLSIVAQRKPAEAPKGQPHLNERRYTRVARAFTLPNTVDESRVEAKLADGVLHLTLHKREEVKARKIEVK